MAAHEYLNLSFDSPIGEVAVIASVEEPAIVAVHLPGYEPGARLDAREVVGGVPEFLDGARHQVLDYLDGHLQQFELPLSHDLVAGDLDRQVLDAVSRVHYGETVSYGQLATRIGRQGAARAVGSALGRNPLPLLVPCHRVILESGEPGNYAGGPELKRRLLSMEQD